jgi:hypothetical protein
MSALQVLIAQSVGVLMMFTLAGILFRRRAHLCWSFVAYLLAALSYNALVTVWPDTFYTQGFWMIMHGLFDALRVAIAVELGFRTFQAFPRAQATARRLLFILLSGTCVALISIPLAASYNQVVFDWQPRVLTGTIWIMNGLALLITWYRVPVHPYHKAILLGFVPYLLIFTTLLSLTKQWGWDFFGPYLQAADPVAFMLLTAFWGVSAWRRDAQPDASPALVRLLQPWRVGA